ncbi:hypothetical protein D5086_030401 [Populus alba]|uniref:Uncharacterized protein n=1 Tax=Populus alba TaxID=43335 RepID=A0ACC4ANI9_POPAL
MKGGHYRNLHEHQIDKGVPVPGSAAVDRLQANVCLPQLFIWIRYSSPYPPPGYPPSAPPPPPYEGYPPPPHEGYPPPPPPLQGIQDTHHRDHHLQGIQDTHHRVHRVGTKGISLKGIQRLQVRHRKLWWLLLVITWMFGRTLLLLCVGGVLLLKSGCFIKFQMMYMGSGNSGFAIFLSGC